MIELMHSNDKSKNSTASDTQDQQNQLLSRTVYLNARALGFMQVIPVNITYFAGCAVGSNFFNHGGEGVGAEVVAVSGNALVAPNTDFNSLNLNDVDLNLDINCMDAADQIER